MSTAPKTCRGCERPVQIAGLCAAHYQQHVRDPSAPLRPLRPRGGLEEIKVRVPTATVDGLCKRADQERQTFPGIVRAALATYLGMAKNRGGSVVIEALSWCLLLATAGALLAFVGSGP